MWERGESRQWHWGVLMPDPPLGVTLGKPQTLRVSVSSLMKSGFLKQKKTSDTDQVSARSERQRSCLCPSCSPSEPCSAKSRFCQKQLLPKAGSAQDDHFPQGLPSRAHHSLLRTTPTHLHQAKDCSSPGSPSLSGVMGRIVSPKMTLHPRDLTMGPYLETVCLQMS